MTPIKADEPAVLSYMAVQRNLLRQEAACDFKGGAYREASRRCANLIEAYLAEDDPSEQSGRGNLRMLATNPRHKYYPKTIEQKLGYLVEECGEVMAAVGKTQRWGLESYNPDLGPSSETNRAWILRELGDLREACEILREALEAK